MDKRGKNHWMFWTKFYISYRGIKTRCYNKKDKQYKNYWGRWIICEWKRFIDFYNDMYESYLEHINLFPGNQTTIDRIDSNWNYCKTNCKWSTQIEQQNNRTNNIMVQWTSLRRYCILYGLKYKTVHMRINTYWWSIEKAIST